MNVSLGILHEDDGLIQFISLWSEECKTQPEENLSDLWQHLECCNQILALSDLWTWSGPPIVVTCAC